MNKGYVLSLILISLMAISATISQPVKADSQAPQMQWSKTYGPYQGFAVIQTSDGGYAIAGQNATYGVHGYNIYEPSIIKTNSSGELEWRTSIPIGGYAISVVQTKDLGFALGCRPSGLFVKLDAQGKVQWNESLGLISCYVIQASDGSYVLAGYKENNFNGENGVLLKTDENGNLVWNTTFSEVSVQFIEINAVLETSDKGYAVAGNWNSTSWFAKTDSNGNLQWNKTYHLSNIDNTLGSISATSDEGYILGGFDQNGAWLAKTDSQGNLQWSHPYPSEGTFTSVAQTPDGGYIAAGDTRLLKTDAFGNFQWNATGELDGTPWAVTVTSDGAYAVTGFVSSSSDITHDVWLAKFAPESGVPSPSPSPTPSTSLTPSPSIPEFPSFMIATLMIAAVVVTAILYKGKRSRLKQELKENKN